MTLIYFSPSFSFYFSFYLLSMVFLFHSIFALLSSFPLSCNKLTCGAGQKAGHPITTIPPTSHPLKDYGRITWLGRMAPFLRRNYSILVNEICSFCLVLWKSLLGFLHASLTLYDAIIMASMVSFYLTLSARYVASDLNFLYSKAFIFWWGLSCHRKVIHLNLFGR